MNGLIQRLPVLVLQPHSRCNCRCLMCDIWKTTEAQELNAAELERHLADIQMLGVEWAVFTGGEPLMHSDLFRLAALLRERRIRTTLLTSGLLVERYAAPITTHIDDVIVSLDGPPDVHNQIRGIAGAFERLRDGVDAIHQLAPEYLIAARCTVQSSNAGHLRATVETARELGVTSISFLAADLTSSAFNRPQPWPEARKSSLTPGGNTLAREIEGLIENYPEDGFILETPAKLRRIAAHFLGSPGAPRCNAPWVSAVIESNGDLRPCFFHPTVGNIVRDGLAGALNGPAAVAFRQALNIATNPVCARCVCSLYRAL